MLIPVAGECLLFAFLERGDTLMTSMGWGS